MTDPLQIYSYGTGILRQEIVSGGREVIILLVDSDSPLSGEKLIILPVQEAETSRLPQPRHRYCAPRILVLEVDSVSPLCFIRSSGATPTLFSLGLIVNWKPGWWKHVSVSYNLAQQLRTFSTASSNVLVLLAVAESSIILFIRPWTRARAVD